MVHIVVSHATHTLFRMASNATQPSCSPSESSLVNIEDDFDILSPLPVDITTASQPPTINFSSTNLVPPASNSDDIIRNNDNQAERTTPQQQQRLSTQDREGFQRRQQVQRQRLHEAQQRLQQERQRLNAAQSVLNRERQRLDHQRDRERQRRNAEHNRPQRQRRVQVQQPPGTRNEPLQNHASRHRSSSRWNDRDSNEMMSRDPLREPMDHVYNESLLESYYYEQMNPQERQELSEQEHLRQMQGLREPIFFTGQFGDLERYALSLDHQLQQDQREQIMLIYDMQYQEYMQQCQGNEELLADKEEWEDIAFRLQQQR